MSFNLEESLAKLSITDKINLLSGLGWWHTHCVPAAGVSSMRMSDGPNGVRGTRYFNGVPSSCFPSSTGLASAFDVDLAKRVGEALGDEARVKSCHILLGPTVNIQRSPLGGRSFESFSEDPYLNGTIAAAYINGLQSKGVAATIKHFVANDQEYQRHSGSSELSERTLREIYLKPFQIAIKKADPWALMSSYNRVNGVHVSESKRLLDDVLRKEWGFKGMVMSDWTGTYSTVESIQAGLDLEMPGPTVMRGKAVERALFCEKLYPRDIDERVRKVFGLLEKAHASGIPFDGPEEYLDTPKQRSLLRTAAADAIVLLKNARNLLPLKNIKKIAVIGPNAKEAMTSGGGSAELLSTYKISPLEGISLAAREIGAQVSYSLGASVYKYPQLLDPYIKLPDGMSGACMEFWNDAPSEDYIDLQPNFQHSLKPPAWVTNTKSSNCVLLDGVDAQKVNPDCWIRYTTIFTPDASGDWEFSMNVSEKGNVFIDNKLVLDLSTRHPPGDSFFGLGTADVKAIVKDLEAGRSYQLEVRVSNATFSHQGPLFISWGGFRLGATHLVDADNAISDAVQLAKESDVAIVVIGLNHDWESEGFDRADLELPGSTNRLVAQVLKASPKTVVVNQSGAPVCMPWIEEVDTVIQAFYGGNEVGNGLADVLFGKVNPSGKLSLTFPKRLEDTPSFGSYSSQSQEYGKVFYNEGIYVGYRSYDIKSIQPLFPFGFGLSYSQFTYHDLSITRPSPAALYFIVSFKITNAGELEGKEVAQVYIVDVESSLPRPIKELKAFTKLNVAAGQTEVAQVELDRDAFGFYDERKESWVAEKGTFKVLIGASSADIRLTGEIVLDETLAWTGL